MHTSFTKRYSILLAALAAIGFILRWLQCSRGLEPVSGFARPGTPYGVILALYTLLALAGLTAAALRGSARAAQSAYSGSWAAFAAALIAGLWFVYAGIRGCSGIQGMLHARLYLARAILCIAAGVSMPCLACPARQSEDNALQCTASTVILAYWALQILCEYLSYGSDPAMWVYVFRLLTSCAVLLAIFYFAGFPYGKPNAPRFLAAGGAAVLLAVISMADAQSSDLPSLLAICAFMLACMAMVLRAPADTAPEAPVPPTAPDDAE